MLYKDLLEMYECGALNTNGDENSTTANVGGASITKAQADAICKQIGWTDYVLNPFKIIDKTAKFMKGFAKEIDSEIVKKYTDVTFRNVRASDYTKTFDRIHLHCKHPIHGFEVSIIYNMPHNSARYVVYRSSNSYPLFKGRNLKDVAEYINSLGE